MGERITRESQFYDPEKTRDFLMEARLGDQLPLINVCDRHGYVEELAKYLYTNNMLKFIQIYVADMNPMAAPKVTAALLDCDCSEEVIQQIILLCATVATAESWWSSARSATASRSSSLGSRWWSARATRTWRFTTV